MPRDIEGARQGLGAGLSAAEIGRQIGAGALDPAALTEAMLAAAAERPDVYVRLTAERARRGADAAAARARAGLRRGPLDGVPISWKDLFDIAGEPTEGGSRLLAGRLAGADAALVRRADAAGLVCLGKTHLSELAFSGLGVNPMTATARNAYDPARAPGGSSSGAAASVAFGLAAAAIGSDTGGSVRIPAAWNGLVGLKTTIGALPMDGVSPLSPTLDTAGPLTRTVEDAALLWSVLADAPAPALAGASLRGVRLLRPQTPVLEDMDPGLAAALDHAAAVLADAGAEIVAEAAPELDATLAVTAANGAIVNTEGYAVWRDVIEAAPERMYDRILARFRSGAGFTSDRSEYARLRLKELKRAWERRLAGCDAALLATTPNPAPLLAAIEPDAALFARENLAALRNTRLFNLLEGAALALPAGWAADQPASVMLAAPGGCEARLLRLGAAVETAFAAAELF